MLAGRYAGRFDIGEYLPVAAGFCGLFTLFGGPGRGDLLFSLGGGTGEFLEIIATESCLELQLETDAGVPDVDAGTAGISPLSLELSGKVDCATGALKGEIRGVYYSVSLCNGGTVKDYFSMKGTISARYDQESDSFVDGVLDIHEPSGIFDTLGITKPPGGKGTFEAAWDPDAGAPEQVDDCLGGQPFTDFDLPP